MNYYIVQTEQGGHVKTFPGRRLDARVYANDLNERAKSMGIKTRYQVVEEVRSDDGWNPVIRRKIIG